MKVFQMREIREAQDYAAQGGQAIHLHAFITDKAPDVFKKAVAGGNQIAHLFDRDTKRLASTALSLGIRRVVIEHQGTPRQHVDLCGGPLEKAVRMAQEPELLF